MFNTCCLKVFATPRDSLPPQATLVSTVLTAPPIHTALSKNILSGDQSTKTSHLLAHETVPLLSITFLRDVLVAVEGPKRFSWPCTTKHRSDNPLQ